MTIYIPIKNPHPIGYAGQDDRERVYTPPSGIELRGMKKLWQPKT